MRKKRCCGMNNEKLYIIGRRVAKGYPEGRYACTKITGAVHDHFYVKLVLDYPSIRAVANDEAWSNAEAYPYCKRFSWLRSELTRQPEEYTGTIVGLEEEDYQLSLIAAIERAIEEYKAKGDAEAVDRLREKLEEAVKAVGLKETV